MITTSLIGQGSYVTGLHQQAGAQASALSGKHANSKQIHETAEKFEAFFIGQMMEHMMSGIEVDPVFGGGHGEEMWRSMLSQEYGKEIAKSGKLGISDNVMKGMLRMQEQHDAARDAALTAAAAPAVPAQDPAIAQQDAAIALVAGARLPARR